MDIEFSCAHCEGPRPNVLMPFQMFCNPTLPEDSFFLVTLDLFHCLFNKLQANDRAQVSMNVHIQHFLSNVSRIFPRNCAQQQPPTLEEVFRAQQTKLTYFIRSRPNYESECKASFIQIDVQLFRDSTNEKSLACRFRGHILRPQPKTTLVILVFDCIWESDSHQTVQFQQTLTTSFQGSRLIVQSRVPLR